MQYTRYRIPALTTLLTLVSLALVFGAVLGVIPRHLVPHPGEAFLAAIPHVNAVVSVVAIGVIGYAWYAIRRGNVARHRLGMLSGVVLFALFLGLYLYKVTLHGPTAFAGPDAVYTFVYLPTLAVHMLLAILCIPLLYYVLLLALTHSPAELPRTNHPRVGRVAAPLWLTSFALGVVVYLLLYVLY